MEIDWSTFGIAADWDGSLEFTHEENGCGQMIKIGTHGYADVAELMELAEEHMKTCSLRTIEGEQP